MSNLILDTKYNLLTEALRAHNYLITVVMYNPEESKYKIIVSDLKYIDLNMLTNLCYIFKIAFQYDNINNALIIKLGYIE